MNNQKTLIVMRFHFDLRVRHSAANAPQSLPPPREDEAHAGGVRLVFFSPSLTRTGFYVCIVLIAQEVF